MKKEHKQLLTTLAKEKRFPLTFDNTTQDERVVLVTIFKQYPKDEIKKVIKGANK